jgi:uracil-DNA glycosylase
MVQAEVPARFRLAQRLQAAFEADASLLPMSTGLNAVLFSAPNWRGWCEMVPDHRLRTMIEQSCAAMATELIRAMRPRLVVAIGFSALRLLGSKRQPLPLPEAGRVLLYEGEVAGIPALAMRHPTPPRRAPSNVELKWIGSETLGRLSRLRPATEIT